MISVNSLHKSQRSIKVLDDVDLEFSVGSATAILGRSGSGKTTLLNLIATFWRPDSGSILFEGTDLAKLTNDEQSHFRRTSLGYVYQSHFLVPTLSAEDNVKLVACLNPKERKTASTRTERALQAVGIDNKRKKYPHELSGGEQQRVGIARAVVNQQKLILADEPTGNLDQETGNQILDLLMELRSEHQSTIIVATHSKVVSDRMDSNYYLSDGKVVTDTGQIAW